jgi:hypothetical protein
VALETQIGLHKHSRMTKGKLSLLDES